MRKIIPFVALLCIGTELFSQSCDLTQHSIAINNLCPTLQTTLSTGDATLIARDQVRFLPGFSISTSNLNGHTFTAKIDNAIATQTTSYEPSTVNASPIPNLDKSNCIPGTIGGSIDVSPSGAATYQLPIQVSPGSHGMQPNLAIVYSSQGGNGLLGWGWNLAGLSAITRAPKNMYYDGTVEAVSLVDNNTLALDGVRLVKKSDNEYYPVNNPYTSIIYNSANGSFKVTTQDGVVMEFGNEGNSKIMLSGHSVPDSWAISRITDPEGNYMQFIYSGDNVDGEYRISEILYTGNSNSGKTPYNSVKFYYDKRTDSNITYTEGSKSTQSVLLTSIKVFSEGTLSKNYEFSYFVDQYSKLYSISLTADGVKFNPTLINWGSNTDYSSDITNPQWGAMLSGQVYFGDFNGDGIVDRAIYAGGQGVSVWINGGGSFGVSIPSDSYYNTSNGSVSENYIVKSIDIVDWNNDGKDEILINYTYSIAEHINDVMDGDYYTEWNRINSYTLNSTDFTSQTIRDVQAQARVKLDNSNPAEYTFYYADFNNDGNIDRMVVKNRTLVGVEGITLNSIPSINNIDMVRMIDFNGDGRVEFLALNNTTTFPCSIWEYQESSHTFVCKYTDYTGSLFGDFRYLTPGDFNGDGKTDFISRDRITNVWSLYLSTGISFVAGTLPQTINYTTESEIVHDLPGQSDVLQNIEKTVTPSKTIGVDDINNDGKSEIIFERDHQLYIYSLLNSDFSLSQVKDISSAYITNIIGGNTTAFYSVDWDHDGQKELICGSDSYKITNGIATFQPYFKISFNNALNRGLFVNSIIDGMNNTSTFTYFKFKDERVFSASFPKPEYPLMLVRGPMQMVSNLKTQNSTTLLSNVDYTYSNGYVHLGGLGFLGFKSVSASNTFNNTSITSNFDYTILGYNGIYSPWLVSQTTTKAGVNSSLTNTMSLKKFDPAKKSFLGMVSASSSHDGFSNITTNSSITGFDEVLGRVTSQTVTVPNWTTTTSTSYSLVSGNISKPTSVTTARNTYSSTASIDYESSSSWRVVKKTERGVETSFSDFDSYGNPRGFSTKSGSFTRNTSCTYDDKGRYVKSNTDVLGNIVTYDYRNSDGAKLSETTPIGTTTYAYAVQGGKLVTTASHPDGTISTNEVGWDESGDGYYNKESITNGNTSTTTFNALGQKVKQTSLGFNGALLTASYTYDSKGQLEKEYLPGISTPNTYSYKDDGRVLSITGHNSSSVTYDYGTNTIKTTRSSSGFETKTFDALGNVISVSGTNGEIGYEYFDYGKVKKITAGGAETSMTYDETTLDQLSLTDPDAGTTSYTYKGFGELDTQTDNLQQTIQIEYYATGQIHTKTGTSLDPTKSFSESYTYYGSDTPKKNGLLKTATRDGVVETYDYDDFGKPISVKTEGDNKTFITTYQYNSEQRLNIINYPTQVGFSLKYEYDGVGNLIKIYRLNANSTTALVWEGKAKNEREQWTEFTMGNGLTTKWEYDAAYMLSSIKTGTSSNATQIQNLGFAFNSKGQLTQRTEGSSLAENFTYDPLKNILTASTVVGQAAVNYTYLNNGNISSTSLAGDYNYDAMGKPHAVVSIVGPSGSTGQSPTVNTTSTFTADNKIFDMDNGIYKNAFAYGPSGNRFKVDHFQNNNIVSSKIYVGNCEFVLDNAGNITTSRTLINAPTGICAVWEKVGTNPGALHYIHTDYLGSWLKITDESGAVENSYSYDAWGRPRDPNTWLLLPISITNALVNLSAMQPRFDRGYTGHEHMAGFGLINMNGRLYDPYLQRFLSPDNVVQSPFNSQSYNRYTYCLNNPLMYTDPSGYTWWSHFSGWVGEESHHFTTWVGEYKQEIIAVTSVVVAIGAIALTAGVSSYVTSALISTGSTVFVTGAGTAASATFLTGAISGFAGGFAGGFLVGTTSSLFNGKNLETSIVNGLLTGTVTGLAQGLTNGLMHLNTGSKPLNFFMASNLNENLDAFSTHRLKLTLGPISFSYNEEKNSFGVSSIFNGNNNLHDYLNYGLNTLYALDGIGQTGNLPWQKGSSFKSLINSLQTNLCNTMNSTYIYVKGGTVGSFTFNPAFEDLLIFLNERFFKKEVR